MIANLITTLLLALGVATGSNQSESGNAFNHVVEGRQKKPIQRELENVTLVDENNYEIIQTIHDPNNNEKQSQKWYLVASDTSLRRPNYYNEYVNIYNSTYVYRDGNQKPFCGLVTFMQIDNYAATSLVNITINYQMEFYTNNSNIKDRAKYSQVVKTSNDPIYQNEIDKTITNSETAYNEILWLLGESNGNVVTNIRDQNIPSDSWVTEDSENWNVTIYNTITIPYLAPNSNINIAVYNGIYVPNNAPSGNSAIFPYLNTRAVGLPNTTAVRITGQQEARPITQEYINVPELMFTIITLPFAFYSTAFNLTIFPNTPYALNFGNLILTILAALILLYLIKKVLK